MGLAVSSTSLAQDARAADERGGYITLMPHYVSPDANRRGTTEDGAGMAFGYGHPLGSSNWSWELHTFTERLNLTPDVVKDFERYGVGFDFNYRFREDGLSPFFLLGRSDPQRRLFPQLNDNDYFANAAFGLVTGGLGRSELRLRTELRYVRDRFEIADEGHKNDRRLGIGIEIPLGRRTVEVEREVVREVVREVTREVPAQISTPTTTACRSERPVPRHAGGACYRQSRLCRDGRASSVRLEGVNFELDSARLTADASKP